MVSRDPLVLATLGSCPEKLEPCHVERMHTIERERSTALRIDRCRKWRSLALQPKPNSKLEFKPTKTRESRRMRVLVDAFLRLGVNRSVSHPFALVSPSVTLMDQLVINLQVSASLRTPASVRSWRCFFLELVPMGWFQRGAKTGKKTNKRPFSGLPTPLGQTFWGTQRPF